MTQELVRYYIAPDGTKSDMNATAENGKLVFETGHFSLYAVAQVKPDGNTSNVLWIALAVILTAAAVSAIILIMRKKTKLMEKS